jgi:hypothetical protein
MIAMVANELDALKSQFSACETIAFADLATNMVLVTNSDTPQERHALDQLCAEAALLLGNPDMPQLGTNAVISAVVSTQDHLRLFLRASGEPNDALCCVGSGDLDVLAFLPAAQACLHRISDDV